MNVMPGRLNTEKQPGIILFNALKPCGIPKKSVLIGSFQILATYAYILIWQINFMAPEMFTCTKSS